MLLVYLTGRCGLQGRIAVQMEMMDGIILEVNATCSEFEGTVCSQLLGAHASTTHCNTVSYTVGKGTTSMLKTLKEWAFRGYQAGCGRRVFLRQSEAVELFIAALYEQPSSRSMAQAQYTKIMYTLYSQADTHQHVTAANGLDYLSPPEACSLSDVSGRRPVGFFRRFHLSEYGWEIKDGIICPSRLNPGEAVTVCNSSIIYTIYQLCSASDVCRITFIKKGNKKGEERQHNIILQP